MNSPTIRLATGGGAQYAHCLKEQHGRRSSLLVSYYYLEGFRKHQDTYEYENWVMDSGAYSAHNSGATIDLNSYIDTCLWLTEKDKTLTEIFALDVIGNPEASLKNAEEMWRQGVPAIPCYHSGEPSDVLLHLAKNYSKIAIGGVAGGTVTEAGKLKFFEECFSKVWPKKIHGFGITSPELIYSLPFHSVDATSWALQPAAYGFWRKFGVMCVRGTKNQDLRSQVRYYLEMQEKARVRWEKQMKELDSIEHPPGTLGEITRTPKLSYVNTGTSEKRSYPTLSKASSVEVKSLDLPPMEDKWVDYWANRGLTKKT